MPSFIPSPQHHTTGSRSATALAAAAAAAAVLAGSPHAGAQIQSLSFTGGVLLNPGVSFHGLGASRPSAAAGPATGSAIDRTYSDGFNRVDATGNADGTTVHWGYAADSQISGDTLVLTAPGGASTVDIDDAGRLLNPSGNLEYRGSFGSLGESDWGILLSVGYQSIAGDASGSFSTSASLLEDRFALGGLAPGDIPPAPYAGTPDAAGPRIGSGPSRGIRLMPGGRILSGQWEFEADLVPVSGGIYLESQIAGRLNAIASAGVFVAFVNADFRYTETSTVAGSPPVTTQGGEGGNDVIYGGFVQLGLDWALWEKASLVVGARWQPASEYTHSIAGRETSVDFTTAVAIHLGFSIRF